VEALHTEIQCFTVSAAKSACLPCLKTLVVMDCMEEEMEALHTEIQCFAIPRGQIGLSLKPKKTPDLL
jgi:hypothetical protein